MANYWLFVSRQYIDTDLKVKYFHVADNSSITTESIPTSSLVEPCTLCDDDGTFDYKENDKGKYDDSVLDDTVMTYSHYCTIEVEQLNDRNSDDNWKSWINPTILSIDECTDLKERCIDCHLLV